MLDFRFVGLLGDGYFALDFDTIFFGVDIGFPFLVGSDFAILVHSDNIAIAAGPFWGYARRYSGGERNGIACLQSKLRLRQRDPGLGYRYGAGFCYAIYGRGYGGSPMFHRRDIALFVHGGDTFPVAFPCYGAPRGDRCSKMQFLCPIEGFRFGRKFDRWRFNRDTAFRS